jgi:hypothetical protein
MTGKEEGDGGDEKSVSEGKRKSNEILLSS